MWLLKCSENGGFSLTNFPDDKVPKYATLSHTWGEADSEVSFQDLEIHRWQGIGSGKEGYKKIRFCSNQAKADKLEYFWVDTCCIDQSSSASLSESINAMYRWYRNAAVCYVYLVDVFDTPPDSDVISADEANLENHDQASHLITQLLKSRWFSRGWTLQELLAPSKVIFYTAEWTEIGTKEQLADVISAHTGIHLQVLRGDSPFNFSVAQRMSWAAGRETTRIEDRAYCLLGIFQVNMAMIYGEGERAFVRLQEEIMNSTDDMTIFAWSNHTAVSGAIRGLLAQSPDEFKDCHDFVPLYNPEAKSFRKTNRGIEITMGLMSANLLLDYGYIALLDCTSYATGDTRTSILGIILEKQGTRGFVRVQPEFLWTGTVQDLYSVSFESIVVGDNYNLRAIHPLYRMTGVHLIETKKTLGQVSVWPNELWIEKDNILFFDNELLQQRGRTEARFLFQYDSKVSVLVDLKYSLIEIGTQHELSWRLFFVKKEHDVREPPGSLVIREFDIEKERAGVQVKRGMAFNQPMIIIELDDSYASKSENKGIKLWK
jgi:hypothetical protein